METDLEETLNVLGIQNTNLKTSNMIPGILRKEVQEKNGSQKWLRDDLENASEGIEEELWEEKE